MNKSLKHRLAVLKADRETVFRAVLGPNHFGLKILDRGDLLFFQRNEDALLCEISARYSLLLLSSIEEWDNGSKIDQAERETIFREIQALYKDAYQNELHPFKEEDTSGLNKEP